MLSQRSAVARQRLFSTKTRSRACPVVCQAGFIPIHKRRVPAPPVDAVDAAVLDGPGLLPAETDAPGATLHAPAAAGMTVLDVNGPIGGKRANKTWIEEALVVDDEPDYAKASITDIARGRTGWLIAFGIGLLLAALVVEQFEEVLEGHVELSFFVPLIMGHGGNTGSQAVTTVIRCGGKTRMAF